MDTGEEVDEHNARLYEEHWGSKGCSEISECLATLESRLGKFKPWVEKEVGRKLFWKKISYMLGGKAETLSKYKKDIDDSIKKLEELCRMAYREKHPNDPYSEAVEAAEIHEKGRNYLLSQLELFTFEASNNLYTSWDDTDFSIQMVLDFLEANALSEPTANGQELRRLETLSTAVAKQRLGFIFIAQATGPNAWSRCMRTSVHTKAGPPRNEKMSIKNAASYVYDNMTEESGFAQQGLYFVVRNDYEKDRNYGEFGNAINGVMGSYPFLRCAGEISAPSLTQAFLAYRVAECGVLLLRTPWLKLICSCRVYHRQKAPVSQASNVPEQFTLCPPTGFTCLCPTGPITGSLFRLGVFLTEILLGTPIAQVQVTDPAAQGTRRAFIPNHASDIPLLKRVLNEACSTNISEAIVYCLQSTSVPPRDEYCNRVLKP